VHFSPRSSLGRLPAAAAPTALAGMALGATAYSLFSMHDAAVKWLVIAGVPVWQVLFARSIVIVGACLVLGRGKMLARAVATPLKGPLAFRGLITLGAWLCYYSAARSLPLAQLQTLYYAAPIMTTVLAGPLLGERVPASRWLTVAIGFAGVVVACDPGRVALSLPMVLVLIAAAFWGYAAILMRQIARREGTLLQMLYMNGLFLVVTGAASAADWRMPTPRQFLLLVLIGAAGTLGQFCLFEGARRAPASVMATVEYTSLIWAFLLGLAIWGNVPHLAVFIGAGLILLAGAVLVTMERRAGRLGAGR
jgi:drug/metabolite transporter (DMT)-like permease